MSGTGFSGGISRRFFIGGAVAFGAQAAFGAQKLRTAEGRAPVMGL